MDNYTEENMEEYEKRVTVMEEDSTEDCKSLLFTSYRDTSEINDQNDSFPYSLDNDPRMGVKEHDIHKPERQNTVSDDLKDDSEIEKYDQMGQIKKNIASAATKNTRQTEKDSKTISITLPPIDKNQSALKPLMPIISPESIDDDDDDEEHLDLKTLIKDKDVLEYMTQFQINSAPKRLFDRPFPTEKNCFEVGQKLEGIDPNYAKLFCVMTVSEVCGYRMKLHFDGYEDVYDFWVNADCPDLFYPGWCELNSRILQPPKDYGKEFDWTEYLKECKASPAPKHIFFSTKHIDSCENQHKFHIGGKLEALDKATRLLEKQLICVATVVDTLGNRVRIHIDGSTDELDYWVEISSTNLHPVRWCEKNGKTLIPPKGYKDGNNTNTFNWTEYLRETNSEPVPEDAFVRRPSRDIMD